jgi:uncharacterized UPF0160 family protein
MKKLVTHSGKFHADDVFATAVLRMIFTDVDVTRSRDAEVIAGGDIVYDVGSLYDPVQNRFDHHQPEGAGARENGIPYAAFGLIWKHFGKELVNDARVHTYIDSHIVERVDANDTGYISGASTVPDFDNYVLDTFVDVFNTSWKESYDDSFTLFMQAVSIAEQIMQREIVRAEAFVEATEAVERAYEQAEDKRIIELERGYPWKEVLLKYPEPQFVMFPEIDTSRYMIQAVNKSMSGYEVRTPFPESWGGLVDAALVEVNNIPGSRFCHKGGFLAVNETREGAREMEKQALLLYVEKSADSEGTAL